MAQCPPSSIRQWTQHMSTNFTVGLKKTGIFICTEPLKCSLLYVRLAAYAAKRKFVTEASISQATWDGYSVR